MLARHVWNLRSVLQAVCAGLVCGNTRTTRHVQPTFSRYGRTCRVVRVLPHTNPAHTALKNAPEDGPVRFETYLANICDE